MERRKKDNHEQEMIEKTSKMKFMDQTIKVTTFVTNRDLDKYLMNYRDISPTCLDDQKIKMWTKKEMIQQGIFFSYLHNKLPKGVKPKHKYL